MLEVHRACEEASRECKSRCDQGTGSQSFSRDRVVRGLANLQRLRSEASSAPPVPLVGVGGVADAAEEIPKAESPHFSVGVWYHGHISGGDASEESQA